MTAVIASLAVLLGAAGAVYYFAPGVAFQAVMRLARRYARLRLREVTVDGHVVPYLEGGQGEPLLLLHGFAANKDHWTLVAPYLTRHYRVIAPDLPGFGDASRHAAASYDLDTQLARIAAFAELLGLTRFHLGGNSMGGYLAAFFALAHPERVASLWLLAPAGVLSAAPSPVLRLIEAGENPLVTRTPADFERLIGLCFVQPPPTPARFKLPLLARAQAEAPFNEKIFAEMFTAPRALEDAAAALATRTLLVWGDGDQVLDPSGYDILRQRLPDVTARLMPRMGHVPMMERPAEAAADWLRFQREEAG